MVQKSTLYGIPWQILSIVCAISITYSCTIKDLNDPPPSNTALTDEEIQLKVQNGPTQIVNLQEIKEMNTLTNSLMTTGSAQAIGQDGLVDLVNYLTTFKNHQTLAENPFQGKIKYERAN